MYVESMTMNFVCGEVKMHKFCCNEKKRGKFPSEMKSERAARKKLEVLMKIELKSLWKIEKSTS